MLYKVAQLILTTYDIKKKKERNTFSQSFKRLQNSLFGGKTGSIDLRELFESENKKGTRKFFFLGFQTWAICVH